jgi:hypothetical protein
MESKGVRFRNKNYGTEEFYTFDELEGKTFDQIALDLWDRQRRKNSSGFRQDVDSSERAAMRQSVKFSWMPPTPTGSSYRPINGARGVLEFVHDVGAREILFFFEPIGGGEALRLFLSGSEENERLEAFNSLKSPQPVHQSTASMEAFRRHSQAIVEQPRLFGAWRLETAADGTPQLEKVVMDKFKRPVAVFIRPVTRYPETPPRVVTRPSISDQCFSPYSGELGWARASQTQQLIWSEHAHSGNPLAELIDELRRKYHIF